jgi:hypothetical protein
MSLTSYAIEPRLRTAPRARQAGERFCFGAEEVGPRNGCPKFIGFQRVGRIRLRSSAYGLRALNPTGFAASKQRVIVT